MSWPKYSRKQYLKAVHGRAKQFTSSGPSGIGACFCCFERGIDRFALVQLHTHGRRLGNLGSQRWHVIIQHDTDTHAPIIAIHTPRCHPQAQYLHNLTMKDIACRTIRLCLIECNAARVNNNICFVADYWHLLLGCALPECRYNLYWLCPILQLNGIEHIGLLANNVDTPTDRVDHLAESYYHDRAPESDVRIRALPGIDALPAQ